jgi:hypothetical protein
MPVSASDIKVAPPTPPPGPPDVSQECEVIDQILAPAWREHEFEDEDDRDAGRSFDATKIPETKRAEIERVYSNLGWLVRRCGGTTENAYTRPEDRRVFLLFVPKNRHKTAR